MTNQGDIAMKKCACCGFTHCCHKETVKKRVDDENEFGFKFSFLRETCAQCGKHIADHLIDP